MEPVVVNLNNELTDTDVAEIRTRFMKERSTLPLMFIATPVDRRSQMYTRKKPSAPILQRIALLASESSAVLVQQLEQGACKPDFKQIFRPPTSTFDVIIQLNYTQLALGHCTVDPVGMAIPRCLPYTMPKPPRNRGVWPVVGYDPAQLFLSEIQAAFDDIALFFYDKYGGGYIGLIWKPAAVQPQPFKASHVNCRMPHTVVDNATEVHLILNCDAVLEDIRVIGRGLVESVVVNSSTNGSVKDVVAGKN
jgi:U3 small nucleolar RNA-associated protein 22